MLRLRGISNRLRVTIHQYHRGGGALQIGSVLNSLVRYQKQHLAIAFADLDADARILIDKARMEAQSHRLSVEDPVTIEYITKYVADVQQRYTQAGGVRPFGISTLVVGFRPGSKVPRLFGTESSGIFPACAPFKSKLLDIPGKNQ
ncbi:hypothetical protein E4U39_001739 [Claviceps sp. Clav50 group G5]|nr:hypothetical protein E4U39_001739 [Claviceps sp. Clav50 group G5]